MRKREHLRGAATVKHQATVAAMMFTIRHGETCFAAETEVRVGPLCRFLGVEQGGVGVREVFWRELEACGGQYAMRIVQVDKSSAVNIA
jgi:hypothetical protein